MPLKFTSDKLQMLLKQTIRVIFALKHDFLIIFSHIINNGYFCHQNKNVIVIFDKLSIHYNCTKSEAIKCIIVTLLPTSACYGICHIGFYSADAVYLEVY